MTAQTSASSSSQKPEESKDLYKTVSHVLQKNLPLKHQSVPAGENTYRRPGFKDALLTTLDEEVTTVAESWAKSCKKNAPRNCLGFREKQGDDFSDKFSWLSYREVDEMVRNLTSGILKQGFEPGMYGIWADNCKEWVITSLALARIKGYVSVAVYEKMRDEETQYVMEHSEMKTVFCSSQTIERAIKNCEKLDNVKNIVCFDEVSEKDQKLAQVLKGKVEIISWQSLMEKGKEGDQPEFENPSASDLVTVNYTSGTSGLPKGVMITNRNLIAAAAGISLSLNHAPEENQVFLSYLPLAHILERVAEQVMFDTGYAVGFWSGEIDGLKDDIASLAPTIMPSVPRVCEIIEEMIHKNVDSTGKIAKMVFNSAVATSGGPHSTRGKLLDPIVFKKVREKLGGRLEGMLSGGAPLPSQTQDFLQKALNIPIVQGYGLTETCGAGCMQNESDEALGCIGAPLACNEIRLVACPDLGYSPDNNPPQGELWIRGPNVSTGYYKDEKKTKEAFTEDGWFQTGDIGERVSTGSFRIIDRKKNLVKLAQGEYVPIEHLESLYQESSTVQRIWVYGDSQHRSLVAVVQPNGSSDESAVIQSLDQIASSKNLHGYERIKAVHLVDKDFGEIDQALETASHKIRRKKMEEYFKEQLDEMYKNVEKK